MGSTPVVLPGVNFYFTNFPVKERLQSIANCEVGEAPLLSSNPVVLESQTKCSNPVVFGIPNKMLQKRENLNPTAQQNRLKQLKKIHFGATQIQTDCSSELFSAWFFSSVIVHRTLRRRRNMQAQTQGPASSPTLWKGTVHYRAEPYAPVRHLDRARGE